MRGQITVKQGNYKNEDAVENLIWYMVESLFAGEVISTDAEEPTEWIDACKQIQNNVKMEGHKRIFHIVVGVRYNKGVEERLRQIQSMVVTYFYNKGFQAYSVFHYGSEGNMFNLHFHVAVNPISFIDNSRLYDWNTTYYDLLNYVNERTNVDFDIYFKR